MNTLQRTWLTRLALLVSAAALLATSPPDQPRRTYEFELDGTGESVALTREQPRALFMFSIRADSLGPDGVESTGNARVRISGTVQASDLEGEQPFVSVLINGERLDVLQSFDTTAPLVFEGTCDAPAEDAPCQASFTVELARNDDGEQGGSLNVDWSYEISSSGELPGEGNDQSGLDPPWSVEVERP